MKKTTKAASAKKLTPAKKLNTIKPLTVITHTGPGSGGHNPN
jgi:hypothetical protein